MAKPAPQLLLCFDFDGTLINHESDPHFHPRLGEILKNFQSRGIAWVINTGRSLSQTLEGLAQHNIFLNPDFIIARECEIYQPGFFSPWKDMGDWNRRAHEVHDQFVTKHSKFLNAMRDFVTSETKAEFLLGDLGNVGIVAQNDEELDGICKIIAERSEDDHEISYHRNGRYLRFSHKGYSKGTALQELARQLNLDRDQVFAAGDNYNDLSMLESSVAKYIACPVNALAPIKDHVSSVGGFVASKPASEGMIEALKFFFSTASKP